MPAPLRGASRRPRPTVLLVALALALACSIASTPARAEILFIDSLIQDCAPLAPASCQFVPHFAADGTPAFDTYSELCDNDTFACSSVDVRETETTYNDGALDPNPVTVEASFCNMSALETGAYRVQKGTGLPLGTVEDRYARCLYRNLELQLSVSNCRDVQLWSCDDCMAAYKRWLCTTTFKRCEEGGTLDPSSVVKGCRDTCFDVVRKCPSLVKFDCPLSDGRDYDDGALCYTLT